MSVLNKRKFLLRFAWPDGEQACRMLGFSPSSDDVAEAERKAVAEEVHRLVHLGVHDTALELADWIEAHMLRQASEEYPDDPVTQQERDFARSIFYRTILAAVITLEERGLIDVG